MLTVANIFGFIFTFGIMLYWTMAFLVLYHLIRFGVSGQPKKIAIFFLAGSLVLTIITILLYSQVDLSTIPSLGSLNIFPKIGY
jgi:hypothetical protein